MKDSKVVAPAHHAAVATARRVNQKITILLACVRHSDTDSFTWISAKVG